MKIDFLIPERRPAGHLHPGLVHSGIGGTEEAYIAVSAGLADLGHQVTVYADCRDAAGTYDGVVWRDLNDLAARIPSDILVTSMLEPLDAIPFVRDSLVYLWLHVHLDIGQVTAAADRWHKLMVISGYSRQAYASVPDDRVFKTRNGIHPAHFERRVDRVPYRIAYGSDYDRGLSILLWQWPRIRAAVPQATLHVFYGWEVFDLKLEMLRRIGSPILEGRLRLREQVIAGLSQEGVVHLGRIGHQEVADEMLAAEVWGYPCVFPETSCITAMKAQAGGAIPVVFPTAALRETVRFGARTIADPLESRDLAVALGEAWYEALIGTLRDRAAQDSIRPAMMADARTVFAWPTVAREWAEEFAAALRQGVGRGGTASP